MEEIRNRVAESGILNLDLAQFSAQEITLVGFDIADHLWQGLVLKEKEFRQFIQEHDWSSYQDKAVYVYCSADAIVPTWAYMLVSTALFPFAFAVEVGTKLDLQKRLIRTKIEALDLEKFKDGRIIIKGCSDIAAPAFAMVCLTTHLQKVAKSIMYGEPCSTVPIYKRK